MWCSPVARRRPAPPRCSLRLPALSDRSGRFIGRFVDGLPTAVALGRIRSSSNSFSEWVSLSPIAKRVWLPRLAAVALIVAGFACFRAFRQAVRCGLSCGAFSRRSSLPAPCSRRFVLMPGRLSYPDHHRERLPCALPRHHFAVRGTRCFGAQSGIARRREGAWLYLLVAVAAAILLGIVVHYARWNVRSSPRSAALPG